MKKTFLFFLLLLLIKPFAFAQYSKEITQLLSAVKDASYYDSLKLFNAGEETIRKATESSAMDAVAEVYIYYGNYFFYTRNLQKSERYYKLALTEAKKAKSPTIEMLAKIRLSFLKYENGDKDQAETELSQLLEESKKNKDPKNIAELLNLLGIIKEENNDTKAAVALYLEGMTISEINNLSYYPAVFKNNLGLIKLSSGKIKEALEDFEKGLEISEKENNKRLSSHIQMNICLANVSDNKPEKVFSLFAKVIEYSRKNNLLLELSSNYINLGTAFLNTHREDLALSYFDSAIVVLENQNLFVPLTQAYFGKIDVLIKSKKLDQAESVLKKAEFLAKKTANLENLSSYYLLSYRIKQERKNYKGALDDYLEHRKLRDSLTSKMNIKVMEELQLKYNVQKKEIELEKEKSKSLLLEQRNQDERYKKRLTIAFAIVILALILGFSYLRFNRKLREKQDQFSQQLIQNIEQERHRISRDLHDDIGQSLSVIKSKIIKENQGKTIPSTDLENELGRVIEQTREISRNLFPTNLEKIGLTRAIASLMESIQNATKLECSYELTEKEKELSIDVKTHVFRIIQECTNNTIKHSGATGLKISIEERNGEFILIYLDNGAGIKIKKDHPGIGLLSMQERAKIINGYLEIDEKTQKGFKLILKFKPVKNEMV